ncbi:MAG: gliding motility protein GldN [Crocinitomicaceae bacterium]|nr:gliding motility protein GldN [Crocinitomicaceae bacterium]MDG1776444.1 gliding motility protein GldN [Crocinitomicaceae bacterium]
MKSLIYSLLAFLFLGTTNVVAQEVDGAGPINVPSPGIIDGVFIKSNVITKKMVPYEHVREADAIWSKRVFEYIDLREKVNHPLYYPLDDISPSGVWERNESRLSLFTVIRDHVMNGDLTVFSPYDPLTGGTGDWDGYQLKYPIEPEPGLSWDTDPEFRDRMFYYLGNLTGATDEAMTDQWGDDSTIVNPDGSEEIVYWPQDTAWYTSRDIIQYRMKEDWFFDKQRSVLDVRIIAIAPVVYKTEEDGNGEASISGMKELFWLYFPHCRFVFNNYFVYNEKNDAQWMSFDDLFWKRRFNSVIYKQSNSYDRKIESYRAGVDALYESEAIKNEIRNIEHDVWSF